MVVRRAKVVDSTHLELSEPIELSRGRTVLVSVADPAAPDAEREDWITVSLSSLAQSYDVSEPEYPDTMVKEPNPDYRT